MSNKVTPTNDSHFESGDITSLERALQGVLDFHKGQVELPVSMVLINEGAKGALSVTNTTLGKRYTGDSI